ncbi:MAG: M48 family metallopeptidase [Gemmatimonadota bacterium]|nr:M48 family metalloprotease [Gemmatimonadota bacterium]
MSRSVSGPRARRGVLVVSALLAGCAVNPATGERELSFVSEAQEIQMGREADAQIVASLGLYPDSAVQRYVRGLGLRMAQESERPNLPWTFRVVDDPVVNAFALPGGFVYITRGIMTHLTSEAELMGVLGHEIGHVTAKHSVNQISRQQLYTLGLGVGMVFSETVRQFGDVAMQSLQLLFLKYGRDDERQADELGFRYMTGEGYDPREMSRVFDMLGQISAQGGQRIPEWLSTHPDPGRRAETILAMAQQAGGVPPNALVRRPEYLRTIDGVVFGPDPREGYFEDGGVFLHPTLRFGITFPSGWQTVNQKQAVQGVSPDQDAIAMLTLAEGASAARTARDAFLGQEGIQAVGRSEQAIAGLPAAWAEFTGQTEDGTQLHGLAAFVEHRGAVFRLLGYTTEARWSARAGALEAFARSFRPVSDPAVLGAQPDRVDVVEVPTSMSVPEFLRRFPSSVPESTVSLINQFQGNTTLGRGELAKRVTGAR